MVEIENPRVKGQKWACISFMARLHPLMYRFLEQRSASCQLEVRLRCSWAHRILFSLDPNSSRKVFGGNFETDHLQLPCLSISIVHGDPANTKLCEDLQRLQPTLYRSLTCLRRWLVGLACGAIQKGDIEPSASSSWANLLAFAEATTMSSRLADAWSPLHLVLLARSLCLTWSVRLPGAEEDVALCGRTGEVEAADLELFIQELLGEVLRANAVRYARQALHAGSEEQVKQFVRAALLCS